jgi:hypothetical protein
MKKSVGVDELRLIPLHETALDLGGLQGLERRKRLVGHALIGQWPQPLLLSNDRYRCLRCSDELSK